MIKKDFKSFKKFLTDECYDLNEYKKGKYDRKIYNWFGLGKPIRIEFYTKKGKALHFKKL